MDFHLNQTGDHASIMVKEYRLRMLHNFFSGFHTRAKLEDRPKNYA